MLLAYKVNLTPRTTMREKVEKLEDFLAQVPPVQCPVRNLFAPGVYVREGTVPKGITATGAVHKTKHRTVVFGHCLLTTDKGVEELKGYHTFVSEPGAKRAIYAIEETIVLTIHPTDETDEEKLCDLLTESKLQELQGGSMNKQVLAQKAKELK
jgi:hypothetical protein